MQTGMADSVDEPDLAYNPKLKPLFKMRQLLEAAGFETMKSYNEMHGNFQAPWSFLVTFCDAQDGAAWYTNPAHVDLRLASRAVPTVSGDLPFYYFDGSTMQEYQDPSKLLQDTFCRTEPKAQHCCHEGQGCYRKRDSVHHPSLLIAPDSLDVMKRMANSNDTAGSAFWKSFEPFAQEHGFSTDFYGQPAFLVDTGRRTRAVSNEVCIDTLMSRDEPETCQHKTSAFFDPYMDRYVATLK
jgi:hypothetical protein